MDKTIEIDDAIKRNTKLKAIIERHGIKMGTVGTGKLLALYLTGMIDIAQTSKAVSIYLTSLGLTLEDYKNLNNIELEKKALKLAGSKKNNITKLEKILQAIKYIISKNIQKDKIIKEINDSPKGGVGSYEKKVKGMLATRKNALGTYSSQLKHILDSIYLKVDSISKLVGTKIKYTKEFEEFSNAYYNLEDLDKTANIKALLGYTTDNESKKMKDQYEKKIILVMKSVIKMDYPETQALAALFKEFLDMISSYSKTFKEYSGGTTADFKDFDKTRISLKYYKELAKLTSNLDRAAEELTSSLKNFDVVLGRSLAEKHKELKKERKKNLKKLHMGAKDLNAPTITELESYLDYSYKSKAKLWQVAQTLEIYLKEFNLAKLTSYKDFAKLRDLLEPIRVLKDSTGANNIMKFLEPDFDEDHYTDWVINNDPRKSNEALQIIDDTFKWSTWEKKIILANKSYSVLKNLISIFMGIGDRIGMMELRKRAPLTVHQLWEYLGEFMFISSIGVQLSGSSKRVEPRLENYVRLENVSDAYIAPLGYPHPGALMVKDSVLAGINIDRMQPLVLGYMAGSNLAGARYKVCYTGPVTSAHGYTTIRLIPRPGIANTLKDQLSIIEISDEIDEYTEATFQNIFSLLPVHHLQNGSYMAIKENILDSMGYLYKYQKLIEGVGANIKAALFSQGSVIFDPVNDPLTSDSIIIVISQVQMYYYLLKLHEVYYGAPLVLFNIAARGGDIFNHLLNVENADLLTYYNYFSFQSRSEIAGVSSPGLAANEIIEYKRFITAIEAVNWDLSVPYSLSGANRTTLTMTENNGAMRVLAPNQLVLALAQFLQPGTLLAAGAAVPLYLDNLISGFNQRVSFESNTTNNLITNLDMINSNNCLRFLLGNYVLTDVKRGPKEVSIVKTPNKNLLIDFGEEADLFRTCIKAMYSKVSSSIGIYDLFKKPNLSGFKFTPDRIILGAGNDTEILDSAVPFYMRLPLFIDAYKELFIPKYLDNPNEYFKTEKFFRITFLPEMQGTIFGPIFNVMWRTSFGDKSYTDSDYKAIIQEINVIYQKYKDSDIIECINDLVKEVNSRYGKIKATEYKYFDKYVKTDIAYDSTDSANILPGEGEIGSESFGNQIIDDMGFSKKLDKGFYDLRHTKGLVYDFMNRLYKLLRPDNKEKGFNVDFKPFVESIEEECKLAKIQKDKYNIVLRGMRGIKRATGSGFSEELIIHEFIKMPLMILDNIRGRIKTLFENDKIWTRLSDKYDLFFGMDGFKTRDIRDDIVGEKERDYDMYDDNIPLNKLKFRGRYTAIDLDTEYTDLEINLNNVGEAVVDTFTGAIYTTNAVVPGNVVGYPPEFENAHHALNEITVINGVRWSHMYKSLEQAIINNSDLFNIREDGNMVFLEFSELHSNVEKTLDYVKRYLDLFRSNNSIKKLEKKYNSIKEELLTQFILGKDKTKENLQELSTTFSNNKDVMNKLIKKHSYVYISDTLGLINDKNKTELSKNYKNNLCQWSKADTWDMDKDLTKGKSIYSIFNQLVVHSLEELTDPITQVMYGKLLEILERDNSSNMLNFGPKPWLSGDISNHLTVTENYSWLDTVMNYLKTETDRGKKNSKIVTVFDDLPENLKENIKSKLPHILMLFKSLLTKIRMTSLGMGFHESYRGLMTIDHSMFFTSTLLDDWISNVNNSRDFVNGVVMIDAPSVVHAGDDIDFNDLMYALIPKANGNFDPANIKINFDKLYYLHPSGVNDIGANNNLTYLDNIFNVRNPTLADIGAPAAAVAGVNNLPLLEAYCKKNKFAVVNVNTTLGINTLRLTEFWNELADIKRSIFEQKLRDMGISLKDKLTNKRQKYIEGLSTKNEAKRLESKVFNIIGCLNELTSEIDELPIYMELQPEFSKKYAIINQINPLMPSSSSIILRNLSPFDKSSDASMLIRGFRSVLSDMIESQLPWTKFLIHQYIQSSNKVDPGYLELNNYQNKLLTSLYLGSRFNNYDDENGEEVGLYQYDKLEREVLDITMSHDSNEQMMKIIETSSDEYERLDSIRLNILDLNISPINIHSLYRQIPFLGLYTYSYNTEVSLIDLLNKKFNDSLTRKSEKFNNMIINDQFELMEGLRLGAAATALETRLANPQQILAAGRDTKHNAALRIFKNCESSSPLENDNNSQVLTDYFYRNMMMGEKYSFTKKMFPYLLMDTFRGNLNIAFSLVGGVNYDTFPIGLDNADPRVPHTFSEIGGVNLAGASTQEAKNFLHQELSSRLNSDMMKYIHFNDTLYYAITYVLEKKLLLFEDPTNNILTSASILNAQI
jgi:hypothetical protein